MTDSELQTRLLVVVGATGSQGGAVLRYFAQSQRGYALRGITRDPGSKAAQELQKLGVEMVKADNNDTGSLKRALSSATHLYANTDSNRHIFHVMEHPEVLKPGQTIFTYAQEIETQQGRNIVDAAAATSTLERVVWSSLGGPAKWTKGKYTNVTMFDSKEAIADMFLADVVLRERVSILDIGFYLENPLKMPQLFCPQKQPDGVYELALTSAGDAPVPHADVESDVGSWVDALFQAPVGTVLIGGSEFLSWKQWLKLFGERNKIPVRYRQAPFNELEERIPKFGRAIAEELPFIEEYGLAGGNPKAVHPEDLRRQGIEIKTSSVAGALRRIDWSSIL